MCIPQTTEVLPEQVIEKQSQRSSSMTYQYYYIKVSVIPTQYMKRQAAFWRQTVNSRWVLLVDKD